VKVRSRLTRVQKNAGPITKKAKRDGDHKENFSEDHSSFSKPEKINLFLNLLPVGVIVKHFFNRFANGDINRVKIFREFHINRMKLHVKLIHHRYPPPHSLILNHFFVSFLLFRFDDLARHQFFCPIFVRAAE